MKIKEIKVIISLAAVSVIAVALGFVWFAPKEFAKNTANSPALNYEVASGYRFRISKLAENVGQISRIRITPDANTMLVATLDGDIIAFRKINGNFEKQDKLFFSLKTNLPGFPPEESGLSGIALGADFEKGGDIFLLYTALTDKKALKNRITRIQFIQKNGGVYGESPVQIFEGNTDSEISHQIQGGVGLLIEGVPHLLFNVGDATKGELAGDPAKDIGKVMLIQRGGSLPVGSRPFPDSPKIQVIGLRNAYDITINPYDPLKRFAIGDTGTDRFDRFLYAKVADLEGKPQTGLNLAWDGTDQSLQQSIRDENIIGSPEVVLHRWDPSETVTDIVFYPGGAGNLSPSSEQESLVLFNVWGKTGSLDLHPGKKIMLGKISNLNGQPKLEISNFIVRSEAGRGKLGHPLGLAVDPQTKIIYFGDILEKTIYKVEPY